MKICGRRAGIKLRTEGWERNERKQGENEGKEKKIGWDGRGSGTERMEGLRGR